MPHSGDKDKTGKTLIPRHGPRVKSLRKRMGFFAKKSPPAIPAVILPTQKSSKEALLNPNSTLRRGNQTANTLDSAVSIGSSATDVLSRSLFVSNAPAASAIGSYTVASAWLIPGELPSFVAYILYAARLALPDAAGKQNLELKIAYATIYGVLIPLGTCTAVILGLLGVAVGFLVAPILSAISAGLALTRLIQKWRRAWIGNDPETLLAQKIEKAQLADKANNEARKNFFLKEAMLLDYFLSEFRTAKLPVDKKDARLEAELQDYQKIKMEGKTISPTVLEKLIHLHFKNDYHHFMAWLKAQRKLAKEDRDPSFNFYDRAVKEKALNTLLNQSQKRRWRTAFLITMGIMFISSFIAALAAIIPFIAPALLLTFKLVGAIAGSAIFASATATGVMSGVLNYRQYKSWAAENKKHPSILQTMRTGMGLQIGGMAIFILSAALLGLSFMPFINLIVTAIVGAIAIAGGLALLGGGIYKAYQARKAAHAETLKAQAEAQDTPDPEIVTLSAHYKIVPAPENKPEAAPKDEVVKKPKKRVTFIDALGRITTPGQDDEPSNTPTPSNPK